MAFKYLFFSMSLFHLFQARVFLSLSLMINAINVCVVCVSIIYYMRKTGQAVANPQVFRSRYQHPDSAKLSHT
jgi:hypothetical protein